MELTFLVDNKTESVSCKAEWGLSILIRSEGHTYLYDTGGSGMFADNARALGIDLSEVEAVMISHGHSDHTDGVPTFTEINKTAPIYIHKDSFHSAQAMMPNGELEDEDCGIRWDDSFKEEFLKSDRTVLTEGICAINDKLTLVGDIPDEEDFKPTEGFFMLKDGKLVRDTMNHEQFLVIEEEKGMHIISGCCHKGALKTIKYAKELFPSVRVLSFTGGMHTYMLNRVARDGVADELTALGVQKVLPLHCTGMNMIITLKEAFEDNCIIACAGDVVEL